MATSTIKSNKGYAVESLSNVKGTIQAGGLYRIGSIHVLNVRLVTTEAFVPGDIIATLPFSTPKLASVQFACYGYNIDAFKNNLRTNSNIPNDTLILIMGVCIA